MHFLEHYYNSIVKYNLIYKFNYKNLKNVPKLKKIILNFGCKTSDLKILASSLLALQLITGKKGDLTLSSQSNIVLKIRKGNPVGCKIVLTKKMMYKFFTKLINEILPKLKNKLLVNKHQTFNTLTCNFNHVLIFKELEKNYVIYNFLKNIQITFITNTKTTEELFFLLNSFKFSTKINTKIIANVTQSVEYNLAKIKAEGSNPFFCFWEYYCNLLGGTPQDPIFYMQKKMKSFIVHNIKE